MQKRPSNAAFNRRRKFFLMIPILAIPFLVMFFWALGGGKGETTGKSAEVVSHGLNFKLPGAHLKDDKGLDKLSFYQAADKDSQRMKEMLKNDPYQRGKIALNIETEKSDSFISEVAVNQFARKATGVNDSRHVGGISMNEDKPDANELKVYQKLEELKKAVNSPTTGYNKVPQMLPGDQNSNIAANDNVDRLERMVHNMKQSDGQEDPQINRLNKMLDKIIEVQHPEMIQDSAREKSLKSKGQVFPVVMQEPEGRISLFGAKTVMGQNSPDSGFHQRTQSFLGIADDERSTVSQNCVEATVAETQTVVNGSTIKLQIRDKIYINGVEIPAGTFIYGTVGLSNERLRVTILSIAFQKSVFPVKLEVFDKNGMNGIYIPGAISRDVSKQSADQAINGVGGVTSLDPSIGAQAASAGIQAAKSLFSQKIKLIRVTIKGNYSVLLKDGQ